MGRYSPRKVDVVADATGLSSRADTALLPLVADRVGLRSALSVALGDTRQRASRHDPGDVFCDLAVMAADGGRCLSDLVALSSQPTLFGEVASVSTARRVMLSIGEWELERHSAGARAGVAPWCSSGRTCDRHRHDARRRALGQGACGRQLQGRLRLLPARGEPGARDQLAIQSGLRGEVEVLQPLLVRKAGQPQASLQTPLLARGDLATEQLIEQLRVGGLVLLGRLERRAAFAAARTPATTENLNQPMI